MIKYALGCAEGHAFESWFPDSGSYETQARRGLIACPVCASTRVAKAIMAPAIVGGQKAERRPIEASPAPVALLDERQRRLREMEAVGRGLASVRLGTAGVAEILESSAPGFRQKQADALRDLVGQFLERPTAGLLCGLSVGLHSFLLGAAMAESLERRRDG